MKFTEFTEGDNKKVTDETIVNENPNLAGNTAKVLPFDVQIAANDNFRTSNTPANIDKAPNVKDIRNQLKVIQGGLSNAEQKQLQNVLKNKSLWSRLGSWGAKTAGRHAGATVASTVTGPVAPAVALVANLALLGYDVYSLGDTIWDWAKGNDVDLKKADASGATGEAPYTAPPRPTSQGGRNKRQDRWDKMYGKTHNPDGSPIVKYDPAKDPYAEPGRPGGMNTPDTVVEPGGAPLGKGLGLGTGQLPTGPGGDQALPTNQTRLKTGPGPSVQTTIQTQVPGIEIDPTTKLGIEIDPTTKPDTKTKSGKLFQPDSTEDPVEFDPSNPTAPNIVTDPLKGPEIPIPLKPEISPGTITYTPPVIKKAPKLGKLELPANTIGIKPELKLNRNRKPPPGRSQTRGRRAFGGLALPDKGDPNYRLNPFRPLPMPDPMNLSRYKSFGESIDEREMTKKEKAKEKRLKKKYDDSDMKASMKKQYGKDWKTVYYATIRKKAMEQANEGYQILPSIDKARYDEIQGMEGPMMTASGKVLYYDPQEGAYYDRDSDMYLSYEEFKQYDEPIRADEGKTKVPDSSRSIPTFETILQNAIKRMNEAPGDEELLRPMIDMDPKVLPIYAKNIIKKFPHLKATVNAMIGKQESVATEGEAGQHDRMYKVVHAKKGMMDIKAKTSYEAAKKFAKEKGLKSTAGVDTHLYPLEEGVAKFYDEYDTPVNIEVIDDKLLYNGKDIKMYNWSIAQSMLTPQMYKNAKSWDDVHTYLKSADDKGLLHQAIRATFETNPENITTEASSPWTSSGKHPEDMDRDELEHEIDIFKQYKKMGMSLSPQEIMRMDSLYDYLDTVDDMVKVTNIKWDSDDDVSNLSTTMMVPVPPELDDEDAEEFIANYITDKTGMTHDGFMIGESNLNEGYEGEISAILQALDIEHHWSDGRLHVNKRDVDDVKDRLADTDMEMPKISIYEKSIGFSDVKDKWDEVPDYAKTLGGAGAVAGTAIGADRLGKKYGPKVIDKIRGRNQGNVVNLKKAKNLQKLKNLGKGAWQIAKFAGTKLPYGMAGGGVAGAISGAWNAEPGVVNRLKGAAKGAYDWSGVGPMVRLGTGLYKDPKKTLSSPLSTMAGESIVEDIKQGNFTLQDLQEKVDQYIVVAENVDTMRKIVANKSATPVKFEDGTMKVDMTTANIFLQAFDKMRDDNQAKVAEMMRTKKGFLRVMDIIYGAMK